MGERVEPTAQLEIFEALRTFPFHKIPYVLPNGSFLSYLQTEDFQQKLRSPDYQRHLQTLRARSNQVASASAERPRTSKQTCIKSQSAVRQPRPSNQHPTSNRPGPPQSAQHAAKQEQPAVGRHPTASAAREANRKVTESTPQMNNICNHDANRTAKRASQAPQQRPPIQKRKTCADISIDTQDLSSYQPPKRVRAEVAVAGVQTEGFSEPSVRHRETQTRSQDDATLQLVHNALLMQHAHRPSRQQQIKPVDPKNYQEAKRLERQANLRRAQLKSWDCDAIRMLVEAGLKLMEHAYTLPVGSNAIKSILENAYNLITSATGHLDVLRRMTPSEPISNKRTREHLQVFRLLCYRLQAVCLQRWWQACGAAVKQAFVSAATPTAQKPAAAPTAGRTEINQTNLKNKKLPPPPPPPPPSLPAAAAKPSPDSATSSQEPLEAAGKAGSNKSQLAGNTVLQLEGTDYSMKLVHAHCHAAECQISIMNSQVSLGPYPHLTELLAYAQALSLDAGSLQMAVDLSRKFLDLFVKCMPAVKQ